LREHLAELNAAKGILVEVTDLETGETKTSDFIRKAAEALNSHLSTLLNYEKIQKEKGYNKPFKKRYIINIKRAQE
jgi:hypothetical protein